MVDAVQALALAIDPFVHLVCSLPSNHLWGEDYLEPGRHQICFRDRVVLEPAEM